MARLVKFEKRPDYCLNAVWEFDCGHQKRYFEATTFLGRLDCTLPTINVCPDCLDKIINGVPMESLGITREMLDKRVEFVLPSYEENCRLAAEDDAQVERDFPTLPRDPDAYYCPF